MTQVSIVIPAYNAAAYLAETLYSVCESTHQDFEVVVVDDGSTDTTSEVVKTIAKFDRRVRLLSQSNCGMSAARNRGIASSNSEYIALIDSDDIWHPEKLRWQLQRLQDHPDHDFSYTDFTTFYGATPAHFGQERRTGDIDPDKSGWVYHHLILDNLALPSSVLFTRNAWRALGAFRCDNQKTDDWEFLVRASQQFKFIRLAESLVLYRQHPQSLSRRLAITNDHEQMRECLLLRFGLKSPDGTVVDLRQLQEFRHAGCCNFADAHCARGNIQLGLREFSRLLWYESRRTATATKLAKSLFRRAFPKSNA